MYNDAMHDENEIANSNIVNKNILSIKNLRLLPIDKRLATFYFLVKNKGPWDYKQLNYELYESLGNFNYGATGAALGIPDQILLRAAGWAQMIAGTSKPGYGKFYGSEPYGDDPDDQIYIKLGIEYYRSGNWQE